MKPFVMAGVVAVFWGCQPARSDIFVEQVNPELATRLIASSVSQTEVLPDVSVNNNPLWIRGVQLNFMDSSKSTLLWYDEQNRITGMIEYQDKRVRDSIEFFQNGQRRFSLLFDATGKPNGPARFYYEDGRVREDGRYEGGRKKGIWRQFDATGKLEKTRDYDR